MNYSTQTDEKFSAKSLLLMLLSGWRVLIVMMLVGAVVLGGYKLLVPMPTNESDGTEASDVSSDDVNNSMYYQAQIQTLKTDESKIKQKKERQEELQKQIDDAEKIIAELEDSAKSADTITRAEMLLHISELRNNQSDMESRILSLDDTITSLEDEIKNITGRKDTRIDTTVKLYTKYVEKYEKNIEEAENKAEEKQEEPSGTDRAKSAVGFAVIGTLLFAALYCIVIIIRFVCGGKLRSVSELQDNQGIYSFGSLRIRNEKKKARLDRWIQKQSGEIAAEQMADSSKLIAAKILAVCESGDTVYVTGTISNEMLQETVQTIQKAAGNTLKLVAAASPVYHADTVGLLKNAKHVVLAERRDASTKGEIRKLLNQLASCGAQIIGSVEC